MAANQFILDQTIQDKIKAYIKGNIDNESAQNRGVQCSRLIEHVVHGSTRITAEDVFPENLKASLETKAQAAFEHIQNISDPLSFEGFNRKSNMEDIRLELEALFISQDGQLKREYKSMLDELDPRENIFKAIEIEGKSFTREEWFARCLTTSYLSCCQHYLDRLVTDKMVNSNAIMERMPYFSAWQHPEQIQDMIDTKQFPEVPTLDDPIHLRVLDSLNSIAFRSSSILSHFTSAPISSSFISTPVLENKTLLPSPLHRSSLVSRRSMVSVSQNRATTEDKSKNDEIELKATAQYPEEQKKVSSNQDIITEQQVVEKEESAITEQPKNWTEENQRGLDYSIAEWEGIIVDLEKLCAELEELRGRQIPEDQPQVSPTQEEKKEKSLVNKSEELEEDEEDLELGPMPPLSSEIPPPVNPGTRTLLSGSPTTNWGTPVNFYSADRNRESISGNVLKADSSLELPRQSGQ